MPFHTDDNRYEHLRIVAEEINPDRRRRPAVPPPPPNRGGRSRFAKQLTARLDQMQQEVAARPPSPAGIQPHLVFRVPLAKNASVTGVADALSKAGISIVGIEGDKAIIAFHDDSSLQALRQGVADYAAGPRTNPKTQEAFASTIWDVLEFIEAAQMRRWGPKDRIGNRLAEEIGEEGQSTESATLYILDVELWHRGTKPLAFAAIQELRQFIAFNAATNERLLDDFAGDTLCLARVSVSGAKLQGLLDLDIVAEIEIPPAPVFDAQAARNVTPPGFFAAAATA